MSPKMKILFVNTAAAICSIHESGSMIYESVKDSTNWSMEYVNANDLDLDHLHRGKITLKSSNITLPPFYFYIFNYHKIAMQQMIGIQGQYLKQLPGRVLAIVLEMRPNDPMVDLDNPDYFDAYLVLDPTMKYHDPRFYAFPRPIPSMNFEYKDTGIPVIGTLGFPCYSKCFNLIVKAARMEFERSVVRMNIPYPHSYYSMHEDMYNDIIGQCKRETGSTVKLIITNHHMSRIDLYKWCSENSLNVFWYTRDGSTPGLSGSADPAIASGRPLSVSSSAHMRHIHQYQPDCSKWSLKDSLQYGQDAVQQMKKDWSPIACQTKLLNILTSIK